MIPARSGVDFNQIHLVRYNFDLHVSSAILKSSQRQGFSHRVPDFSFHSTGYFRGLAVPKFNTVRRAGADLFRNLNHLNLSIQSNGLNTYFRALHIFFCYNNAIMGI